MVMGIINLALIVLAMVLSAAPLPFSDELGERCAARGVGRGRSLLPDRERLLPGGAAQVLHRVLEDTFEQAS